MHISEFDYYLPSDLIAQSPPAQRGQSRLMVLDRITQSISHKYITDLPGLLGAGDLLILNDTRVFPARLSGSKSSGGRIEVLFVTQNTDGLWEVLLKSSRRTRIGEPFTLAEGTVEATVEQHGARGAALLRVSSRRPLHEILEEYGEIPLPPYIRRKDATADIRAMDRERYQTVYARETGAVAAPTAGLHFTDALFHRLEMAGIGKAFITLHVGPGTFRPVTTEQVEDHQMHAEQFDVTPCTAKTIRERRGRCIAVGSTSVRALESAADGEGRVSAGRSGSSLFIYPPYRFKVTEGLLTNFHLPRSSLIMMVCAFGGKELVMRAYTEAVRMHYRFFSYGDAMLIL